MTSGSRVSTCEKVNMTHKLRFTKSVLCTGYLNNTSPSKFSAVAFKGMFTSFRATFILVESLPVLICPYMIPPKNVIPERVTVPELEFHSVKKSSNSTTPWKNSHSFRYEIDFSLERNQYRMRVQISKIQHGVFLVESGSHRSSFNKSEIGRETGDYASEMSRSF